ncbi:MAG: alpha/beta hydrolase, partial [Betaproteobacteria bacterium]|nr:alpha/beta hydrolase [Betaproteobacteria bacterium]
MLFITSRMPTINTEPEFNRNFVFDLKNNSSSRSFFCCQRHKKGQYEEIGSAALLQALKNSKYRQVLVYIHGFSKLPEDVFASASELQKLCDKQKTGEVLVVPLIWPCDADFGIIKDYWDDQKAADQSAFTFARLMQRFMKWRNDNPDDDPCLKRINVLAHSMGNRVLRQTLANWRRYDQPQGLPLLFRNSFLVAADIVNESLHKGEEGELISHASRNVVVYYASDDLALRASKVSNLKNGEASRRLGHSGPENMDRTPKNVYAIDCDDINTQYDPPIGHVYFSSSTKKGEPGLVFLHIFQTMLTGRVFPNDEFRKSSI